MKRCFIITRIACLFGICVCATMLFSYADKVKVNFDSLYPSTPFKTTLVSCLQVLEDFNLVRNKTCTLTDYETFTDLIVGKLFHIKMCFERIEVQKPSAHPEDLVFLDTVFEKILLDYRSTCSCYMKKPKSGYVVQLISDIKTKCKGIE